ncbi:MAG TPA: hypothetical protein VF487_17070 [Chitinophagaceae bacterium]
MSCCGNKRKEWLNEVSSSTLHESGENRSPVFIIDKPERIFEYLGNNSLAIKGAASGKRYHFRFKGDKVKVDYIDSLAMMAERDLKVLFPPPGDE